MSASPAPISAVVTAYRRIDQTIETLRQLRNCVPAPAEVIVHVDGGHEACATAITAAFPDVTVLMSTTNVGPGGGRNLLVEKASQPLVASFDDDAYPIDADFFARAVSIAECFRDAAVIAPRLFQRGDRITGPERVAHWVADYVGASCVFRRDAFLAAGGYVPVPIAYGIEEADLALRLHAGGGRVLHTDWLRSFHDTALDHHASDAINAATITNLALLAYLRYPPSLWPAGFAQCARRVFWLITHHRWNGIGRGIRNIPASMRRYSAYRRRVSRHSIVSYWRLRRHSIAVEWISNGAPC
jgi:GT2 family glycosyltransferase